MKLSKSTKIYFVLLAVLVIVSAITVFLPQGNFLPVELPASKGAVAAANAIMVLVIYGGLGFLGMKLANKLGFARIWDNKVSNKQRFLIPLIIGAALGVFFIIYDLINSRFHDLGRLPHPPFPTSIFASLSAGIGEELIFRLFFISFWVWLISYIILKKKFQKQVFWIIAVISALAFAIGHLPSLMLLFGFDSPTQVPGAVFAEMIVLNGILSIFAAFYFRKFGFLAAVGIHFWADIVWHVLYGLT